MTEVIHTIQHEKWPTPLYDISHKLSSFSFTVPVIQQHHGSIYHQFSQPRRRHIHDDDHDDDQMIRGARPRLRLNIRWRPFQDNILFFKCINGEQHKYLAAHHLTCDDLLRSPLICPFIRPIQSPYSYNVIVPLLEFQWL